MKPASRALLREALVVVPMKPARTTAVQATHNEVAATCQDGSGVRESDVTSGFAESALVLLTHQPAGDRTHM